MKYLTKLSLIDQQLERLDATLSTIAIGGGFSWSGRGSGLTVVINWVEK